MSYLLIIIVALTSAHVLCDPVGRVKVYDSKFNRIPGRKDRYICTEETIVRDGKEIVTMHYNLTQSSVIKNNQTNKVTTPAYQLPASQMPSWGESLRGHVCDYLSNPLAIGAIACVAYLLYCVKSKFNLYSLGKACIEKAVWSLWKNKTINSELDEHDAETALLIQIIHAYETNNYTVAITQFLRDVESETELLEAYINEATKVQTGILRFVFADLSKEILEAQKRLDALVQLKNIVLGWLHPKKAIVLEELLASCN